MAGSPGVVGMAEVLQPNSSSTPNRWQGQPVMWSMIWVGVAFLFLVMIHLALMGRS